MCLLFHEDCVPLNIFALIICEGLRWYPHHGLCFRPALRLSTGNLMWLSGGSLYKSRPWAAVHRIYRRNGKHLHYSFTPHGPANTEKICWVGGNPLTCSNSHVHLVFFAGRVGHHINLCINRLGNSIGAVHVWAFQGVCALWWSQAQLLHVDFILTIFDYISQIEMQTEHFIKNALAVHTSIASNQVPVIHFVRFL